MLHPKSTPPRLAVIVAILSVLLAGCWDTGDDAVDAGATEETGDDAVLDDLALNDFIADNGYDDVTLGRTLEDLHRQYGGATFELIDSTGSVSTYSPEQLSQLRLTFDDGVLRQVDVMGPGVKSINGEHQVGDPIGDVIDKYQQRIEDGEPLSISCADGMVLARARPDYRLGFAHDGSIVTLISAYDRGLLMNAGPCADIVGPVIDQIVEEEKHADDNITENDEGSDDSGETVPMVTVDSFVPEAVAGDSILVRDPSADQLSDSYAALWMTAAFYFKPLEIIDMGQSIVTCMYDANPKAVAVGVYRGGEIVIAVAADHIASVSNAICALKEVTIGNICPRCLMAGPSADGYLVEVDGVTYAIAYGVIFSRANMMDAICNDLPYCAEARFAEVPADLLDGK